MMVRRVELVTARAVDQVESPGVMFPLEDARRQLVERVLGASIVPPRKNQVYPAGQIVDAFIRGLGTRAEHLLSGYMDRAAARIIQLITDKYRELNARPTYDEVVELTELTKERVSRPATSRDRYGPFTKGVGYLGYQKSLYAQDWFDSSTERVMANILEDEERIVLWARLQIGDLPILWKEGREYNPDLIAVDRDDVHWVIEVKMDREMESADVQGKRQAAARWANHVSADEKVGAVWCYLLVSEADVAMAQGSWEALKGLGSR